MNQPSSPISFKGWSLSWQASIFAGIVFLGLFLRLTDLTDPPLDFHPTRQLRSALLARSFYYQMLPSADPVLRQTALETTYTLESLEPPLFERLVAFTYLLAGGESLWFARLYAILFWFIGGLAYFDLARRMTSLNGALTTLAYYLLLPFSIVASRSFQPDPLMVMGIGLTVWSAYRWAEISGQAAHSSLRWAVLTGFLAGLTVLAKVTAAYYLVPALTILVLTHWGLRRALTDKSVWLAAFFTGLFPALFYLIFARQASANWFAQWGLSFTQQLLQPRFYILWLKLLDTLMDLTVLALAAFSLIFFPRSKDRWLVSGMAAGYFLFGLSVPHQINTHEYYSLVLVPILALALAPLGERIFSLLSIQPAPWRYLALPLILLAIAYPSWITYSGMIGNNYDGEAAGWREMGAALPSGAIIGLTHDYGTRIAYYGWRPVQAWLTVADFAMLAKRNQGYSEDFEALFAEKTQGMDYFLVTLLGELDAQSMLKARLYDHYPLLHEGKGYLLFDLRHPH